MSGAHLLVPNLGATIPIVNLPSHIQRLLFTANIIEDRSHTLAGSLLSQLLPGFSGNHKKPGSIAGKLNGWNTLAILSTAPLCPKCKKELSLLSRLGLAPAIVLDGTLFE